MENINNESAMIVAIKKAISDKALESHRPNLKPGVYHVDMNVQIKGSMVVSEDTEKESTCKIPYRKALALFIHYAGITGPTAIKALQKAMIKSLKMEAKKEKKGKKVSKRGSESVTQDEKIEAIVDAIDKKIVAKMISKLPLTKVTGAVRPALEYTIETPVEA